MDQHLAPVADADRGRRGLILIPGLLDSSGHFHTDGDLQLQMTRWELEDCGALFAESLVPADVEP